LRTGYEGKGKGKVLGEREREWWAPRWDWACSTAMQCSGDASLQSRLYSLHCSTMHAYGSRGGWQPGAGGLRILPAPTSRPG